MQRSFMTNFFKFLFLNFFLNYKHSYCFVLIFILNLILIFFTFSINAQEIQNQQINLNRNVKIIHDKTIIQANKAKYKIIENEIKATGNISIEHLQEYYSGDALMINLHSGKGYIENTTYFFKKNNGHGTARRINFLSKTQAIIREGIYSTCESSNPDWYIHVSKFNINKKRDVGTMYNSIIYFKDIPIFGVPLISFALSGKHKSGLLLPTVSITSINGIELTIPYSFYATSNRNLKIYSKYIIKRALQFSVVGEYLTKMYTGKTTFELIQEKKNKKKRYLFSSFHTHVLTPQLTFSWNFNKVSNNNYFINFSNSIIASTQHFLIRDVNLTYKNIYLIAIGRITQYKPLQGIKHSIQKPYNQLPQLKLNLLYKISDFNLNFISEYTYFSNIDTTDIHMKKKMIGGNRIHIAPSLSYPMIYSNYFIIPKITLNTTIYYLNNVSLNRPKKLIRVIPTYSINIGTCFKRHINFFHHKFVQTLEPRLFYLYVPYYNQNYFPNFNSSLANFNFIQMFSENRFINYDRISNTNQITGVITSCFFQHNKLERLRVAIGQQFYFSKHKVILNNSSENLYDNKSDVLLLFNSKITNQISLENTIKYSNTKKQLTYSNFRISWFPSSKKILNLRYELNYTHPLLKCIDISSQWPVSKHWYIVSHFNYLIQEKTITKSLLGIEYKTNCFVLRLIAQRIPNAFSKRLTSVFIQFELNGFSKFGSNLLDILNNNIPNYQIVNH